MKRVLSLVLTVLMLLSLSVLVTSCNQPEPAEKNILTDVRIRKALSLAIDRDYLNETIWNNSRVPAYGIVPQGIMDATVGSDFRTVGGNLMSTDYAANIVEAKKLLAEAGYPDGVGFPILEFSFNTSTGHQRVAEAIQAMWKENLGIAVKLSSMEWNVFTAYRKTSDCQVARQGWLADYADASTFFDLFLSTAGTNDGHYNSAAYDKLVKDAKAATDPAVRADLYHKAEKIIMDDMPMIPLVYYADDVLIQTDLTGVGVVPTGNKYFWNTNKTSLTACVGPEPATLDPNLNETVDGMIYISSLFEGIYRPNADGTYELGMAKSVTNDGTKYTAVLRDDIFWSDGQPVKAQDFVYSWRRLCDPATASSYGYIGGDFFKNGNDVLNGVVTPDKLTVKAIDDKTLEFEVAVNVPYLNELLAFPSLMPIRQDIVEANPDSWAIDPATMVFNGRYVLDTFAHEDKIIMTSNDKYWDKASTKTTTITFKLMSDDNAILAAFKNKELDLADSFPVDELAALEATPEFHRFGNLGLYYLQLNNAP
jgi:ABC-type oligopeptide transport system substrate-binding subunit